MADVLGTTLVSKDNDANAVTNPIFTKLTDGTSGVSVTGTSLDVNITGGSSSITQFAEDSAHTSGDQGVEILAVRQDTLSASVSADGDYGTLKLDSLGRLWVNVNNTVTVSATSLDIRALTHATDSIKVGDGTDFLAINADGSINITDNGGSLTVDGTVAVSSVGGTVTIQDGGNVISVDDAGGSLTVDGTVAVSSVGGTVTVSATALDIRTITKATDSIQISANTSANSLTNPIFVQVTDSVITGEVNSFNTGSAVAAAGTSNHDYTVTNTMKLKHIILSASGKCKFELQVGPVASLVSKAVAFVTPTNPTVELRFDPPIEVPSTSTGTVRIIRTNRENQAQDVYSTIIGLDN